jgi:hypothetical protein
MWPKGSSEDDLALLTTHDNPAKKCFPSISISTTSTRFGQGQFSPLIDTQVVQGTELV